MKEISEGYWIDKTECLHWGKCASKPNIKFWRLVKYDS